MNNNLVFKHLIQVTGLSRDTDLICEIFRLSGVGNVTKSKIRGWRARLDDPRSSHITDSKLLSFFDGLMEYRDKQAKKGIHVFQFLDIETLEKLAKKGVNNG